MSSVMGAIAWPVLQCCSVNKTKADARSEGKPGNLFKAQNKVVKLPLRNIGVAYAA